MEPPTRFTYPARDGVKIAGYRWDPAGQPRGAVQLTHGMGEHVQRYSALAHALTGRGLVVLAVGHQTAAGEGVREAAVALHVLTHAVGDCTAPRGWSAGSHR